MKGCVRLQSYFINQQRVALLMSKGLVQSIYKLLEEMQFVIVKHKFLNLTNFTK